MPPYLIALGIGDIGVRAEGPRTGVYTEPAVLSDAAKEFVDLERMVAAAESLLGPYRWGRYDLLILPPSFPFGGMENPRLTFATPTIIAGDRSLVSLVAHSCPVSPKKRTSASSSARYMPSTRCMSARRRAMPNILPRCAKGWLNLPDDLAQQFPTQEHLRKHALIRAGFRDERSIAASSRAEALRLAAFVKPIDEYAIVTTSSSLVVVYTAKSQSYRQMGRAEFQRSKQAVLDFVDSLLGVERGNTTGR